MAIEESIQDLLENIGFDLSQEGESQDSIPGERLLASGAAVLAAVAARRGLKAIWKQTKGTEPPEDPSAPGVTWRDALLWGAAAGALAGIARVVGRRTSTKAADRIAQR